MAFRAAPLRRTPSATAAIVGILAAMVAAAVLLPGIYLVVRVSDDWGVGWETLTASRTVTAAKDTIWFAIAVSLSACAIAVPAAWLTSRTDLPFARAWVVLLSLPLAIPSYVSALTIVLFLGPKGILQGWLEPFGVDRLPPIYGFWGAWFALVFFTYPYALLPVRAALLTLDRSFEEASRGLGKSALTTFLRVVLPQLRPALVAGGMIVALYTISDFGAVSTMRYNTLSRLVYLQYEGTFNRQAAAALGLLLAVIAFALVTLESLTRGRARYHSAATQRSARKARLGKWKWLAFAYLGTLLLVALVMPIGVLAYEVYTAMNHDVTFPALQSAAWHSVYAATLAAIATLLAALPIGYLAARKPGLITGLLERASYAGYALPGVVIGLALVFFGANYALWAYQTLAMLVFALVVRFLPEASGPARAAFLKVNPKTEEAGRSLGRSPAVVFFKVTLPQLLPGLSAAGALVFLTAIKELPITLLLSPIEFDTLASQVWMNSTNAFYARASFAALVLVLVASVPVLLLALRERTPR